MKQILCPIDFSGYTDEVIQLAADVATPQGTAIHLLYVIAISNYNDFLVADSYLSYTADVIAREKSEADSKIKALIEKYRAQYPQLVITADVIQVATTEDGILDWAEKNKTDLIVLGSHGRRGFRRLLLGSVAESILRGAKCNVLIYKVNKPKTTSK